MSNTVRDPSHPWHGKRWFLPPKAYDARKAYLEQWRDRMSLAYAAGATDDVAVAQSRECMALKERA